jgi:uncharacterized protein
VSLDIVVACLIVGLLVGLTGSGDGALLTPVLILLFGVTPSAAISNGIVASAIMRPIGGAIHFRKGTVQMGLVLWLSAGSVPAAFAGAFIEHAFGTSRAVEQNLEYAAGAAVILAVAAMAVKMVMDAVAQKNADDLEQPEPEIKVKRVRTVAIGVFGGLLVGIISVGAGSLMIVLLMMLYPRMSMRRLVGTDIVQSIPLTGGAGLSPWSAWARRSAWASSPPPSISPGSAPDPARFRRERTYGPGARLCRGSAAAAMMIPAANTSGPAAWASASRMLRGARRL